VHWIDRLTCAALLVSGGFGGIWRVSLLVKESENEFYLGNVSPKKFLIGRGTRMNKAPKAPKTPLRFAGRRRTMEIFHPIEQSQRGGNEKISQCPIADDVLRALLNAGEDGLSRTDLRDLFGRNRSASAIDNALQTLARAKRVRKHHLQTGGRPSEMWAAAREGK
jgi:hypothetical protein